MRKFAILFGVLTFSGPAFAADMAVKASPPVVATAFSWTGCYVGGNAGGAWGNSNVTLMETGAFLDPLSHNPPADVAFSNALGSPGIRMSGFTGGGQVGCNYQAGSFVFGIEGDGEYTGLSGSAAATATLPIAKLAASATTSVSSHSLFTVRPRAGFAVDRTLFYVTGGYAGGNVTYSESMSQRAGVSTGGTVSSTQSGWTIGGGIEYAMTNNWTIKGEYLYVNLGSVGFAGANIVMPTFTTANSATFKENIGRLGLNYKF
ncbi:MAG TPA: outer membrane beta-barrel protein [Xanthobacteraceae bacterium]